MLIIQIKVNGGYGVAGQECRDITVNGVRDLNIGKLTQGMQKMLTDKAGSADYHEACPRTVMGRYFEYVTFCQSDNPR